MTETIRSLLKQLHHFVRASGKAPAAPLPPPIDLTEGDEQESPPPDSPIGSDDERPLKKNRPNNEVTTDDLLNGRRTQKTAGNGAGAGKTSGKASKGGGGRAPRQVVPGPRGLVAVEMDKEGNTHPLGEHEDGLAHSDEGEEAEDQPEKPVAKRPELDDAERKRRTEIKEKEREREEEVVRRLTKEEGGGGAGDDRQKDVEIWEGVELVSAASTWSEGS